MNSPLCVVEWIFSLEIEEPIWRIPEVHIHSNRLRHSLVWSRNLISNETFALVAPSDGTFIIAPFSGENIATFHPKKFREKNLLSTQISRSECSNQEDFEGLTFITPPESMRTLLIKYLFAVQRFYEEYRFCEGAGGKRDLIWNHRGKRTYCSPD